MTYPIPDHVIARLSDFIKNKIGLHFTKDHWVGLIGGVTSIAKELGFDDPVDCVDWIVNTDPAGDSRHIDPVGLLVKHLTIGETYFFRPQAVFSILKTRIFPQLIKRCIENDEILKIWSAGCSTGEEAYSLGMCLNDALPSDTQPEISILAADINADFIHTAREGVYTDWSFRDAPDYLRRTYFKRVDDVRYIVSDNIKKWIRFFRMNLIDAEYPSSFTNTWNIHVIVCQNVLIYFDKPTKTKIIQRFIKCLHDGGWLVVSPSDAPNIKDSRLQNVSFGDTVFFQKTI